MKGPAVDARPLSAWGFYARNVERITFEDVRLSCTQADSRPVVLADTVRRLILDNFKFTRVPGVAEPVVSTNGGKIQWRNPEPQATGP